jgi:hypothetical protein
MLLADQPEQRQLCPVTPFLALAIADGAIEGIQCADDFRAMAASEWSGCISLRYANDAGDKPIFRRTGNRSKVISSCSIKASGLQKNLQAQVTRAGHECTFSNMLLDARTSSQRLKRGSS